MLGVLTLRLTAEAQDSAETLSHHFQFTVTQQAHPSFNAKYTGQNSLLPTAEDLMSVTSTLFLGTRLWKGSEIYFNPEMVGGNGFSSTTGIAGFPNGEMYRVVVVPGPLVVRGNTTASRVSEAARLIEVDEIIPVCDRWRVAALAVAVACRPRFHPVKVIGGVE